MLVQSLTYLKVKSIKKLTKSSRISQNYNNFFDDTEITEMYF